MNVDGKEEKEEKEETKKATDELEAKVERKMDAIEQMMTQFKDAMQTIVQTQQEMKKDSDQGLINLQTESANQAARIKADMKMLQSRPQAFRTKPRAANNQAKPAEVAEVEGSESEEQRRLDKKGNLRTPPRLPKTRAARQKVGQGLVDDSYMSTDEEAERIADDAAVLPGVVTSVKPAVGANLPSAVPSNVGPIATVTGGSASSGGANPLAAAAPRVPATANPVKGGEDAALKAFLGAEGAAKTRTSTKEVFTVGGTPAVSK